MLITHLDGFIAHVVPQTSGFFKPNPLVLNDKFLILIQFRLEELALNVEFIHIHPIQFISDLWTYPPDESNLLGLRILTLEWVRFQSEPLNSDWN